MFSFANINASLGKKLGETGIRYYVTRAEKKASLKKLYEVLEVSEDCDDETLRLAFVHLVKKYHPDSGSSESNANKFSEVESAYRKIQNSRSEDREKEHQGIHPEADEFDIKHTAPQHRHYLQYDVGIGTPSMRQRRYTMQRAQKAIENVIEHKLMKIQSAERNTLIGQDKLRARDIKTRYGVDRVVEDLIQESMNKGEFNNLSGMGKPLKNDPSGENPYVDFITHKLNQILIDNGFTPEWIQLSKEIREETDDIRKKLIEIRNELGTEPLNRQDQEIWEYELKRLESSAEAINKKIDKYNLLVPVLQKQRLRIDLKIIANEILKTNPVQSKNKRKVDTFKTNDDNKLINVIMSAFLK